VTAPLFLVDGDRLRADRVLLDGPEGHHAATVRRLGPGKRLRLADGDGLVCDCIVAEARRDVLELDVVDRYELPPPEPRLVVVQALPKGDRGELAVEVMTEAGADAIVPWAAARCIAHWKGPRGEKTLGRWRAHAREAAKQARRARVPKVAALASTREVIRLLSGAALGLVLHEEGSAALAGVEVPPSGDVVVVVGPEGGIATEEVHAFSAAGALVCRIGPEVLRTSTAGVVALSVLQAKTERWR
jgi:16S rRNA (uracil1498-N3)-methyltransferase